MLSTKDELENLTTLKKQIIDDLFFSFLPYTLYNLYKEEIVVNIPFPFLGELIINKETQSYTFNLSPHLKQELTHIAYHLPYERDTTPLEKDKISFNQLLSSSSVNMKDMKEYIFGLLDVFNKRMFIAERTETRSFEICFPHTIHLYISYEKKRIDNLCDTIFNIRVIPDKVLQEDLQNISTALLPHTYYLFEKRIVDQLKNVLRMT